MIKSDLQFKVIDLKDIVSDYNFEACSILLTDFNLMIVCIYRTPTSDLKMFFNSLTLLLEKITKRYKKRHLILCGDWNIDILKQNKHSDNLISILNNFNILNHINQPTRKKSCLDLIASNISGVKFKNFLFALSDHEMCQNINFNINKCKSKDIKPSIWFDKKRDYSQENIKKFIKCMSALSFSEVYETEDVNECFNLFHDIFCLFYNLCFPNITVKIVQKQNKTPWLTRGIKRSCINKRRLFLNIQLNRLKKSMCIKNKYKKYSKTLKKCIALAQRLDGFKYLSRAKNKCKATWALINRQNGKENFNKNGVSYIINNNNKIDKPQQIADAFNNYFINLTNENCINRNSKDILNYNNIKINPNSIYLTPVTETDVIKTICNLNNTKSAGYDNISTNILKLCKSYICFPLCHIINNSFSQGVFPERLKLSIVKPLFKKGESSEMSNYRPITLVPVLSKIIEKMFHSKLSSFLNINKIICTNQFGFQKGMSTTLACFEIIKTVTESLNEKIPIAALLLDMTKAFDFVCHDTLLIKLERYGVRGVVLNWIKTYLKNRFQCTSISKFVKNRNVTCNSQYRANVCGVPQGSILGPLLFITYINDLPNITSFKSILFADDTTFLIQEKNHIELNNQINIILDKAIGWLKLNNLNINLDKTEVIKFETYNSEKLKLDIRYDGKIVKESDYGKFLGITIDKFCNWKEHIGQLCDKLDRFVYILYRIRTTVSKEAALLAYHGYVASILRYGIILWGYSVDAMKVFKVQKKCIRALFGLDFRETCYQLFKKYNILSLPSLYIYEICTFVRKNPHFFECISQKSPKRRKHHLKVPHQRIVLYSKNCFVMAINVFNKLPENIKELPLNKFKTELMSFLSDKCYYNVNEFLEM